MRLSRWFSILLLLSAACGLLPGRAGPTGSPAATNAATLAVTPGAGGTAAGPGGEAGGSTATPAGPSTLRVWLPPEFTPDLDTPGGRLLAEQIQAFENAYPGTAVEIRTKAASGQGGLLASLVAAANAAPGVLPDVIALKRDDLVTAVAAGLAAPPESLVPAALLDDYYPFAQSMGKVNGDWQALPFAADARVMAYLTSVYPSPPLRWNELLTGTLVIPAAEPSGLTLLTIYLAQGGGLQDAAGKVALDVDVLARTLELLQGLQADGTMRQSTVDYADPAETWEVFRQRRANLAVTTAHYFLAEYSRLDGASATLLPTSGEAQLALVDGWSWVLVGGGNRNQALAAALASWLLQPERHAAWTEAANVLPTRAGSLALRQETRLGPIVSGFVAHAQLQPSAAVVGSVGPALKQALADVLAGRATPFRRPPWPPRQSLSHEPNRPPAPALRRSPQPPGAPASGCPGGGGARRRRAPLAEPRDLVGADKVYLVGAGKAGAAMAAAAAGIAGDKLAAGVMAVPTMPSQGIQRVTFVEGGHPSPTAGSLTAGRAVEALLSLATERDLVLVLISGGGSALMELPRPGISLDDLQQVTALLLRSGAAIQEINVVRRHLSRLKGGGLARLAHPARVLGLILRTWWPARWRASPPAPRSWTWPNRTRRWRWPTATGCAGNCRPPCGRRWNTAPARSPARQRILTARAPARQRILTARAPARRRGWRTG